MCSRELNSVMNQADRNKPLFVMGHHGLCFLEKEEQAEVEENYLILLMWMYISAVMRMSLEFAGWTMPGTIYRK